MTKSVVRKVFVLYLCVKENVSYGTIAFIEIMVFIATLIIGLIYAWKKGTFDWNVQARAEAKAEASILKNKKIQRVEELKRDHMKIAA